MSANLNIELYKKAYFYFDKPVEYQLKDKKIIYIYPIIVKDSEIFLSSVSVISIDKNLSDSVEIIQMSYLDFIYKILFQDEINISRFINILRYCLHIENPEIGYDENQKPFLKDKDTDIVIKSKDFDNIRKLILYQNLVHYDDEYINPDLKEAIEGTNRLRNKNIEMPTIERKCAIITAHCGLSKKEQLEMTMRSHSMLFDEIYGEIEFTTTRPIFLYAGKGKDIDHWIYRKKRNKLDGYITEKSTLVQQMGGDNNFVDTSVNTSRGDSLEQLYKQGGQ